MSAYEAKKKRIYAVLTLGCALLMCTSLSACQRKEQEHAVESDGRSALPTPVVPVNDKGKPDKEHFTGKKWLIGCAVKESSAEYMSTAEADAHLAVGDRLEITSGSNGKYTMKVTGSGTSADWSKLALEYLAKQEVLGPDDPDPFTCDESTFAETRGVRILSEEERAKLAAADCSASFERFEHMAGAGDLHKGHQANEEERHCVLVYTRPSVDAKKSEIWVKYWHTKGGSLHGGVAHGGDD